MVDKYLSRILSTNLKNTANADVAILSLLACATWRDARITADHCLHAPAARTCTTLCVSPKRVPKPRRAPLGSILAVFQFLECEYKLILGGQINAMKELTPVDYVIKLLSDQVAHVSLPDVQALRDVLERSSWRSSLNVATESTFGDIIPSRLAHQSFTCQYPIPSLFC